MQSVAWASHSRTSPPIDPAPVLLPTPNNYVEIKKYKLVILESEVQKGKGLDVQKAEVWKAEGLEF